MHKRNQVVAEKEMPEDKEDLNDVIQQLIKEVPNFEIVDSVRSNNNSVIELMHQLTF